MSLTKLDIDRFISTLRTKSKEFNSISNVQLASMLDETISNIIYRAGGLLPQAYPIASTFTRQGQSVKIDIRKVIKKPNSRENIFVQDNDSIFIAEKPNIFQIVGEVSSPGFYKFS